MNEVPQIRLLIDVLAEQRPQSSRTTLRQLLEAGRVHVNGETVRIARMPIARDDHVEIGEAAKRAQPNAPFPIVYEDADLLVINKPAGLITSTTPKEKRPTALAKVLKYAQTRKNARVGLVHRLDRDASGLLVFAMSQRGLASLKAQFSDRTAGRIYTAVVARPPHPTEGTIRSKLVEYADGSVHSTRAAGRGTEAVTHYETISSTPQGALLRITLETGRKHQIRAHMAQRNHPILGDTVYGGPPAPRLMLAAVELRLRHPADDRPLVFKIELPPEFAKYASPAAE